MKYLDFFSYNIIGGILWVALFLTGGYFFGQIPVVKNNLALVTLLIIIISFIPPVLEYIKAKKAGKKTLAP